MKASSATLLLASAALSSACALAADPPGPTYIEHVMPPGSKALPFSDAVLEGNTLYVAGHLGIDPATGNAAADAATEAHLVLDAVQTTLGRAGLSMDDLVSVTVYCTDLALYDTFNGIYQGYFHGHHPARAFIGTEKLLRGARFEVLGVAVKEPRRR